MKLFIAILISSFLPVAVFSIILLIPSSSSVYDLFISSGGIKVMFYAYLSLAPYTFIPYLLLALLFSFLVKHFKFNATLFYVCSLVSFSLIYLIFTPYKFGTIDESDILLSLGVGLIVSLCGTPLVNYFKKKLKTASQEK